MAMGARTAVLSPYLLEMDAKSSVVSECEAGAFVIQGPSVVRVPNVVMVWCKAMRNVTMGIE